MTSPTTGRQGPSSIWFVVGAILIALGIIGGIVVVVIGVQQVTSTVDGYERVSASSGGEFVLDEAGTYRIFYEAPGASDEFVSAPPFDIVDASGGTVAVRNDNTSETYTFGSREGRKLGKFTAPRSGTYEIRVLRGDGMSVSGPSFAIGKRGPTGSIFTVLGGVFGGLGVAAIGGVILIVTGVKRGSAKRSQLASSPGWGAPGPGWGGPPPAWGGPQPGWGPPPQTGGGGRPQGWAPPPPAGPAIPTSVWGLPPSGGVVPEGTQWGTRPDPPPPAPEKSTPPGWAPPPAPAPPPLPDPEPAPGGTRLPPSEGPIS